MIVVDTEFTALNWNKGGLWQIGAVDSDNPKNTFLEEARLEDDEITEKIALEVVEKTEKELRDKKKQSQREMLEHFFKWINEVKIKNFLTQGPWDFAYILTKAKKFGLKEPFHHRSFDLHSIAQIKYFQLKGKFLTEEDHSGMSLTKVLEFCGIKDERIKNKDGKIIEHGKSHNALEDAKLTAECFSRLVYGKNLFPEYSKFPIPMELLK